MSDSGKIVLKGNDDIQICGDRNRVNSPITNVFILPDNIRPLSKSTTHELLRAFLNSQGTAESDYSLQIPAEMNEKLLFNEAPTHADICENHSDDLVCISEVIGDFPDSEKIVRKLRDIFLRYVPRVGAQRLHENGDECLDCVEREVRDVVQKDKDFSPQSCPIEELERFSIALVAYGVSKCKVLENPNDNAAS